jgi:hypothetical protein
MSPPEVWGPAIWTLFHTLADRIREDAYEFIFPSLFNIITRICKYLPCPECANDATIFLARIKHSDLRTKTQFKNTFYLFHNYVNAKKRKRLFNYSNINIYNKLKLVNVINNFINNYQTKGNMKLINESFQRQFVINDFKNFIKKYIKVFIPNIYIPKRLQPVEVTSDKANEIEFKNTKKQLLENIEAQEDYLYKSLENEENQRENEIEEESLKNEIEEELLKNEIKNILDEVITIIEQ